MFTCNDLILLVLISSIIPSFAMDKSSKGEKDFIKKGFGPILKELEKKKKNNKKMSEASGQHGVINLETYGQHHTTKLGFIKALKEGDIKEVKRVADKHSSYVASPQLVQLAIREYEKTKQSEHKEAAIEVIKHVRDNKVLHQLDAKTGSVNDAIQIVRLSNDGDLPAVIKYAEKKKKNGKNRLSRIFPKKEVSESTSAESE